MHTATQVATIHCPDCNERIPHGAESCTKCGHRLPKSVAAPSVHAQKGWGDAAKSFKCEGCGADVVMTSSALKYTCPYCGNERVLEAAAASKTNHQDDVRPELVLPFKVPKTQVGDMFRGWVGSLWFAPNDLLMMAASEKIRGIYLPFWCYDTSTHTYYSGEYGVDRTESWDEERDGQRVHHTRTITDWYHRSGWSNQSYEDVLVLASRTIERSQSLAIEPFHLKQLVAFSTELLEGWDAERYAFDHSHAWEKFGKPRVVDSELARCSEIVGQGADHVRGVNVHCHFTELDSQHLLLPVYVSAFEYNGKRYHFLINGQTGAVRGERPYSFWKIFFFVLTIALAIAAVVAFFMLWNHR